MHEHPNDEVFTDEIYLSVERAAKEARLDEIGEKESARWKLISANSIARSLKRKACKRAAMELALQHGEEVKDGDDDEDDPAAAEVEEEEEKGEEEKEEKEEKEEEGEEEGEEEPAAALMVAAAARETDVPLSSGVDRVHIFVDNTNLCYRLDLTRLKISGLVQTLAQGRMLVKGWVAGSGHQPKHVQVRKQWRDAGFDDSCWDSRGGPECNVDEALHSQILDTANKKFPDMSKHTLVLVTGDGNQNKHQMRCNFPKCVVAALKNGWRVEVWAWGASTHALYKQYAEEYQQHFLLLPLDEVQDRFVGGCNWQTVQKAGHQISSSAKATKHKRQQRGQVGKEDQQEEKGAIKREAMKEVERAKQQVGQAKQQAEQAMQQVEKAKQEAEQAKQEAEQAKQEAEQANQEAEQAKQEAEQAKQEAEQALEQARRDADLAKKGEKEAKKGKARAQNEAEEWRRRAQKAQDAKAEAENAKAEAMKEKKAAGKAKEVARNAVELLKKGAQEHAETRNTERKAIVENLSCPISLALMVDPVVAADGHSYERKDMEEWLERKGTSPKTNAELEYRTLVPNHALRAVASGFRDDEEAGS
jgi:hypothetical protein